MTPLPTPEWTIPPEEIEIYTTRGTGPGGQHRNTTDSCVVMRHVPTGIEARSDHKSQHRNREIARSILERRVHKYRDSLANHVMATARRQMVGSGMRGDKIRTYREKDNRVIDHRSGKCASLRAILSGDLDNLWG